MTWGVALSLRLQRPACPGSGSRRRRSGLGDTIGRCRLGAFPVATDVQRIVGQLTELIRRHGNTHDMVQK